MNVVPKRFVLPLTNRFTECDIQHRTMRDTS